MEAKVVDQALQPPAKCLVTGDTDGPFIDTGTWARQHDPYIYLHVPLIEYYARELLGMVSAEKVADLEERLAENYQRLTKLQRFVDGTLEYSEIAEEVAA
jgi:hypothetical protein